MQQGHILPEQHLKCHWESRKWENKWQTDHAHVHKSFADFIVKMF